MAGTPLKTFFPFGGGCQSLTRKGNPCRCREVIYTKKGTVRCKYHGGASTGPRTPEGKAKLRVAALANLRKTPSWKKHLATTDSPPATPQQQTSEQ